MIRPINRTQALLTPSTPPHSLRLLPPHLSPGENPHESLPKLSNQWLLGEKVAISLPKWLGGRPEKWPQGNKASTIILSRLSSRWICLLLAL